MDHQLFNNQSIDLSLSSENGNIIEEGKITFETNPIVSLTEVLELTDSVMIKRQ